MLSKFSRLRFSSSSLAVFFYWILTKDWRTDELDSVWRGSESTKFFASGGGDGLLYRLAICSLVSLLYGLIGAMAPMKSLLLCCDSVRNRALSLLRSELLNRLFWPSLAALAEIWVIPTGVFGTECCDYYCCGLVTAASDSIASLLLPWLESTRWVSGCM